MVLSLRMVELCLHSPHVSSEHSARLISSDCRFLWLIVRLYQCLDYLPPNNMMVGNKWNEKDFEKSVRGLGEVLKWTTKNARIAVIPSEIRTEHNPKTSQEYRSVAISVGGRRKRTSWNSRREGVIQTQHVVFVLEYILRKWPRTLRMVNTYQYVYVRVWVCSVHYYCNDSISTSFHHGLHAVECSIRPLRWHTQPFSLSVRKERLLERACRCVRPPTPDCHFPYVSDTQCV
jgi:hypothetical protein